MDSDGNASGGQEAALPVVSIEAGSAPAGFAMQQQQMDLWCWAAVTLAVCNILQDDNYTTQPQIVALVTGNPACDLGVLLPVCNQTKDLPTALGAVNHYGKIGGVLEPADLLNARPNASPIACDMNLAGGLWHAVLIVGAYSLADGSVNVQVADPGDGSVTWLDYYGFRSNYNGNGGTWVNSYTTG
jgi:hypothetical protein